ncbi:hypothetical protein D3C87_1939430 [compost metagenome]
MLCCEKNLLITATEYEGVAAFQPHHFAILTCLFDDQVIDIVLAAAGFAEAFAYEDFDAIFRAVIQ